jgi:divalent metal cation (Fe/Co/Zn/Cd) transporter
LAYALSSLKNTLALSVSKHVVYAALAGKILVAVTKAGAAFWTGSSAMFWVTLEGAVDCRYQNEAATRSLRYLRV